MGNPEQLLIPAFALIAPIIGPCYKILEEVKSFNSGTEYAIGLTRVALLTTGIFLATQQIENIIPNSNIALGALFILLGLLLKNERREQKTFIASLVISTIALPFAVMMINPDIKSEVITLLPIVLIGISVILAMQDRLQSKDNGNNLNPITCGLAIPFISALSPVSVPAYYLGMPLYDGIKGFKFSLLCRTCLRAAILASGILVALNEMPNLLIQIPASLEITGAAIAVLATFVLSETNLQNTNFKALVMSLTCLSAAVIVTLPEVTTALSLSSENSIILAASLLALSSYIIMTKDVSKLLSLSCPKLDSCHGANP